MAATDVLTLEAAKEVCYRSAGDTRDDTLLAAMVTALSDRLDRACGPIVQRAVASEAHDGGCGHIQLRLEPVSAVSSVVEWHRGSQETLTAETNMAAGGYLLCPWSVPDPAGLYSGRVERRTGWGPHTFRAGRGNVVVSYTAGRYADADALAGTRFGELARLAIGYLWRRRDVRMDADWSAFFPATIPQIWRQLAGADWREGLVVA